MAVISVRDLLRGPKAVFENMEETNEPYVVMRRGRPVAALVPIDQDQAETLLLASSSELVASARRAEGARAEGRTTSLETALQEAGISPEIEESASEGLTAVHPIAYPALTFAPQFTELSSVISEVGVLAGPALANEAMVAAARSITEITQSTWTEAVSDGLIGVDQLDDSVMERFSRLNARLLAASLSTGLQIRHSGSPLPAAFGMDATPASGESDDDENSASPIVHDALEDASNFVRAINVDVVRHGTEHQDQFPITYEASLRGSIEALERFFHHDLGSDQVRNAIVAEAIVQSDDA